MAERKKRYTTAWDSEGVLSLRRRLKLTQAELAQLLGARQQTISEWETGVYRPRGLSATLLSMVAERPAKYNAARPPKKPSNRKPDGNRPKN